MFKQVSLYERKAGISAEAFRAYYEETHVRTRLSSMTLPGLRRYMRRYLTAIPDPVTGKALDLGYDVITELWFEDKLAWENYRRVSLDAEVRRIATDDELLFMDQDAKSTYLVDECVLEFASEGV